ncbi:MAG: hypothetical protein IJ571_00505 [Ruminococcus sp.]|nr:hypothetical protein [Ruminococcus sp.]
MPRLRKKKPSGFTIISNQIFNDKNLDLAARGLICTMLSKPDSWNFTIRGLASELKEGKYKIEVTLNLLAKYGYLMRNQIIEQGKFVDMEYIINDEPMPEAIEAYKNKEAQKARKKEEKSQSTDQAKEFVEEEALKNDVDTHFSPCPKNRDTVKNDLSPCPNFQDPEIWDPENRDGIKELKKKINNTNNLSYQSDIVHSGKEKIDKIDRIEKQATNYEDYDTYKEIIKENIEYDYFASAYREPDIRNRPEGSIRELDEIVEIMTETVCSSAPNIRVGKENKPSEVVRSRFLKINDQDILYLFECLAKQTKKIHNPKAYIITSLYNTPLTKELGTSAAFRHDFSNDPIMLAKQII